MKLTSAENEDDKSATAESAVVSDPATSIFFEGEKIQSPGVLFDLSHVSRKKTDSEGENQSHDAHVVSGTGAQ